MARPEQFHRYRDIPSAPDNSSDPTDKKLDILNKLEQAVGQIQDSETFRRYLDVQARFHRYSWGNVALILAQRPHATRVAGYRTWLELNRYVRRGEKGIKIIVPMRRKEKDQNEQEGEVEMERLFFGTGTVFDVSQTDGEPLPEVEVPVLDGTEGREVYEGLEQLALSEGLFVKWNTDELPENAMGAYFPKKRGIVIREAAPLQMTKTLAHELAHHFAFKDVEQTRGEHEAIAEASAYVVCSHFGLDTDARSFPYIALWSKDKAVLKGVLITIQKVSAKMIDGLENTLRPETER